MTVQERKEMFAKEYLSIDDIGKLFDINYKMASAFIVKIKKKLVSGCGKELRLDISGKIHIEDYLDYIGVKAERYSFKEDEELWQKNG